ncbi:transposase [Actinomycetes bacterium NPDC127524]
MSKRILSTCTRSLKNRGLEEYRYMKRTFENWEKEILNSFLFPYTNGFINQSNKENVIWHSEF